MFARASAAFVLALPLLATALPGGTPASNQCTGGSLQCCASTQEAGGPVNQLLGLLGIVSTITGLVGLNCSPLTIVGVSGTSCTQQSVCCTGNSFSGLVVVGCTPINANL